MSATVKCEAKFDLTKGPTIRELIEWLEQVEQLTDKVGVTFTQPSRDPSHHDWDAYLTAKWDQELGSVNITEDSEPVNEERSIGKPIDYSDVACATCAHEGKYHDAEIGKHGNASVRLTHCEKGVCECLQFLPVYTPRPKS